MIEKTLVKEIKTAPFLFGVSVLLAFLSALALIVEYWFVAKIIHNAFLEGAGLADLKIFFGYAFMALLLRVLFSYLENVCSLRLAAIIQCDLRGRLTDQVPYLGPSKMQSYQSGTMLNLVLDGIDRIEAYFKSYLPQLLKALFIPVLFLVVVFPFDRLSGMIFLLTIPLIPFFMTLIGKWTMSASKRQWQLISQLSGYLNDVLRGLETLIVLGRSKKQAKKIADISESYRVTTLHVQKWAFISSLALELVATISIALVAVGLGLRLVSGDLNYQIALFILLLAPEYYQPMRNLGAYFHASLDAEEASRDIYAFLTNKGGQEKISEGEGEEAFSELSFRDVSFSYPEQEETALQNINFTLKKGESVALVGFSGSGKSTLMQIALGFLDGCSGDIFINGKVCQGKERLGLQENIAYIPQSPYVFPMSIAENIAMASNLNQRDLQAVEVVAQETGLTQSLSQVGLNLFTQVGQGGVQLSGGQEELLFLSRGLYGNKSVLFFDEITDNMDLTTEKQVTETIHKVIQRKTSLIIAHRISTIASVDRILLLDKGRIVAQGNFDSLKASSPLFRRLIRGDQDE